MKLYPILFSEARLSHPELSNKKATIDQVQRYFSHFHLSRIFLGEPTFQFTPRVPSEPFVDDDGNTNEDDFTKRISLAADIEDARDAISDYGATYYYIYATQQDEDIEPVEDNMPDCPKVPPKPYNITFNMKKWLKINSPATLKSFQKYDEIKPSTLPQDLKDKFEGCVPDANRTHEEWSRQPLQMLFIGTIGEANQEVQLSNEAARIMGL